MSKLTLAEFLPYRLSVASNLASSVVAQAYVRMFALSIGEWRVMALLAERDRATQQELVVASRMDKMSISRAVRGLASRQLVARVDQANDRRAIGLSLTTEGRTLYARVVPEAKRLEAELLSALSTAERDALDAALRTIEAAAVRLTNP